MWESFPHDTPDVLHIQQQGPDGTWVTIATETTHDTPDTDPWADAAAADTRTKDWHLAEDRAAARLNIAHHRITWQ